MDFRVLAVGDVVGNPGLEQIRRNLRQMKRQYHADFAVVNGENAAVVGITPNPADSILDAGADIVFGSHPHVLQPIEEYGGGIIFYSLGNFSFGGNGAPKDYDTALVQQEVIRDAEGTVSLGQLSIVPASVSSVAERNNFQPTPYEPGTEEYNRVLSKLDETFSGPNLKID